MPILSDEWEAETLRVSGIKVANAEYTALAVNNLENVADVLKRLMAFTINPKASGEYLDIILNDCEEALNRIS